MKIRQYFNSLVSRRKSTTKSSKSKSHHPSISSADCHYEICTYEEPCLTEHPSRTEILLQRHAQLVNTIVSIRSQQDSSCLNCRHLPLVEQQNLFLQHPYSNTLATSNPRRECPHHQIYSTSNNNSLRQRSKIRTNPWITKVPSSQVEHLIYVPNLSSGLIHSESFPQTISNGNIIQSDSGQGFSLSSSRVIDSSSTDNTSSDSHRPGKKSTPTHFQRSSATRISTNPKRRHYQTRHTSPRLYKDEYSMEFENTLENERLPSRRSPFILPLDEIDMKTSTNYSGSLKKTNSHTILKHIEEIENEIQMIKNLNFDADEQLFYPNEQDRTSIHQQIDQWVDQCLTNSKSSIPKMSQQQTELMTAFYLTSIPTKRTVSYVEQSIPIINSQTIGNDCKSTQECPF